MDNIILIGIMVVCIILMVVCVVKHRPDMIVNFMLRACLGTAGIYLLDMIFNSKGYSIIVGINGITVMTAGLLGLPGFLLLYGLAIYYSFH